jgi:methylated-DNA-[protein]-cysteine S-methyltransferase
MKEMRMNLKSLEKHAHEISIRLMNASPIGPILFAANSKGLMVVSILADEEVSFFNEKRVDLESGRIADEAVSQMMDYFNGTLQVFSVPVNLMDLTDFQREVLLETKAIPFGEVLTYGEVAMRIGRPRSARAVGGALARNPIGIIIPCHRVVAHDGKLHGFSSPHGIVTKAKLLENEGIRIANGAVQMGVQ